jgi:hypothetical protein
VTVHTFPSAECNPDEIGREVKVRGEYCRSNQAWYKHTEEVVNWVKVLSTYTHCVHEGVMYLVKVRVESPVVHEFVAKVKGDVFCDHQKYKLQNESRGAREVFNFETKLTFFVDHQVKTHNDAYTEYIVAHL